MLEEVVAKFKNLKSSLGKCGMTMDEFTQLLTDLAENGYFDIFQKADELALTIDGFKIDGELYQYIYSKDRGIVLFK